MSDLSSFQYIRRRDDAYDDARDREIEEFLATRFQPRLTSLVTSTTRPTTNLFRGQQIFETDTGNTLVWYGATTGWLPPWEQPWGEIAKTTNFSGTTSGTTLLTLGTTSSVTVVSNRNILVEWTYGGSSGSVANDTFAMFVQVDTSSLNTTTDDIQIVTSGNFVPPGIVRGWWVSNAGSRTFRAACQRVSGTGTFTAKGSVTAIDIGPAGNAPAS